MIYLNNKFRNQRVFKHDAFTVSREINISVVFQMYVNFKAFKTLLWDLVFRYVVDCVPRMSSHTFF